MTLEYPPLIAIVGQPGAGKSLVQGILAEEFGIAAVDDGNVLRQMAVMLFDLSEDDVLTSEGKKRTVRVNNEERTVRWILGELGNALEERFGRGVVAEWAIRTALEHWRRTDAAARPRGGYSFGSVRKMQPWTYLHHGGFVLEVVRHDIDRSPHAFDSYAKGAIDYTIVNPGDSVENLRAVLRHEMPRQLDRARDRMAYFRACLMAGAA